MPYDNVKQFGTRVNPKEYYVVGLPWKKNQNTGNYSCAWACIKKQDRDFYFILKKSNGKVIGAAFVPSEVVMKASTMIWKVQTKEIPDPNDPTKTAIETRRKPIALIPKKVVHNWMKMDEYKDCQFG